MVDLVYCLTSLLFFDIPLYYYINVRSSIIFYLFCGDIYVCLGISVLLSTISELFCAQFLESFVILWEMLLPSKSLAVFWICCF